MIDKLMEQIETDQGFERFLKIVLIGLVIIIILLFNNVFATTTEESISATSTENGTTTEEESFGFEEEGMLEEEFEFGLLNEGSECVTHSLLTTGTGLSSTSFNTATTTPSANKLVLVAVTGRSGSDTTPTLSGNSMTWVQVSTYQMAFRRITLFRGMASSPTTGSITISFGASTQDYASWVVSEFSNIDTSGSNGANAVVQSATNGFAGGNIKTLTVTLSSFSSVDNATYGTIYANLNVSDSSVTEGSGFTAIDEKAIGGEGSQRHQAEWKNETDTSVDWTFGGTDNHAGAIAVEIKCLMEVEVEPDYTDEVNIVILYFIAFMIMIMAITLFTKRKNVV